MPCRARAEPILSIGSSSAKLSIALNRPECCASFWVAGIWAGVEGRAVAEGRQVWIHRQHDRDGIVVLGEDLQINAGERILTDVTFGTDLEDNGRVLGNVGQFGIASDDLGKFAASRAPCTV
jgi:hypothetical protein